MIVQALWTVMVFYLAFSCFELFRFEEMPMRILAFLFALIAIGHGYYEIGRLYDAMYGFPIDKTTGLEIFLPMILVGSRQLPRVRIFRYGRSV